MAALSKTLQPVLSLYVQILVRTIPRFKRLMHIRNCIYLPAYIIITGCYVLISMRRFSPKALDIGRF